MNHIPVEGIEALTPPAMSTEDRTADRIAQVALFLVMAFLCGITWHKWGALTVDCGREMYVPAAISQGKRLYFDLWYPYGPLVAYRNAALLRVLGVDLSVLYANGIALVTITAVTLYSLSRTFLPVWMGFTVVFVFLVQAFQLSHFNYVLPYSYPAAFGAMFSTVLLWLLVRDCFEERRWRIVAAGLIAGLALLTKIEFGLAAYGFLTCALAVRAACARSVGKFARDAVLCAPGFLLCVGVYGLLVAASSFAFIFEENIPVAPHSYFVSTFGKLWAQNLGFTTNPSILIKSALGGLFGAGQLLVALWLASVSRTARRTLVGLAIGMCVFHLVVTSADQALGVAPPWILTQVAPFYFFNRGLLWLSVVLLLLTVPAWWRSGRSSRDSAVLLLAVSSLAVGCRVLTAMAPTEYPIFYDTTAYLAWLVALYALSRYLPVQPPAPVWKGLSALSCCGVASITLLYYPVQERTFLISSPRGSLYTDQRTGEAFTKVLAFLESAKSRSEHFAVMPEDTSLYYFSATLAPSRWYDLTPGVLPPGAATSRYLDELDRAQVKYVVLSDRSTPAYRVPIFGADYDQPIYQWLQQNFDVVAKIGDYERVPHPAHWGVLIYARKAGPTSVAFDGRGGAEVGTQ